MKKGRGTRLMDSTLKPELRRAVRQLAEVRATIKRAEPAFRDAVRQAGGGDDVRMEEEESKVSAQPAEQEKEPSSAREETAGGEGGTPAETQLVLCGKEREPFPPSRESEDPRDDAQRGEDEAGGRRGARRGRRATPPLPDDTVHRIVRRAFRYVGRVIHPDRCSDAQKSQRFPEICAARDVPELHPIVLVADDCRIRMCLGTTHLRLLRTELSRLLHQIRQEKTRAVYRFATARTEGERKRFARIFVEAIRRADGGY